MKKCTIGMFSKIVSVLTIFVLIAPMTGFSLYMALFDSQATRDERIRYLAGVLLFGGLLVFACYRLIWLGLVWVEYDGDTVVFHYSRKETYRFSWDQLPGDRVRIDPAGGGYVFSIQGNGKIRKIPVNPMSRGFRDLKKMMKSTGVLGRCGQMSREDYAGSAEQVFRQFEQYRQANPGSVRPKPEGGCVTCTECQGRGILVKRGRILNVEIGRVCKSCGGSGYQSFYPVSKRARAAYLILCLEETIKFYGLDFEKWEWVLSKLWEITSTGNEEDWIFQITDLMPEEVLPYSTYEELEEDRKSRPVYFKYSFSEARFLYLHELYRESSHSVAEKILDNIFSVVADDWGESEEPNTPPSLKFIEKTQELMAEKEIPLPSDWETVRFLMNQEDKHLGKPFDGWKLSTLSRRKRVKDE